MHLALWAALALSFGDELQLKDPQGCCFDAQGRLFVADSGNGRILVFTPALELLQEICGTLRRPMDVAVDSQGRRIVVDPTRCKIVIFDSEGKELFSFGDKGSGDGQFEFPTHVSVDDADRILVTDRRNRIQVFDKEGHHRFTLANQAGSKPTDPGQLNEPGAIFVDSHLKRLFVANGWNCRIEIFDYDEGRIERRAPSTGIAWGLWVTRAVAGDDGGRLFGVQTAHGTLRIFENRSSLTQKSTPIRDVGPGPFGTVADLNDIAVSPTNGDIALVDARHDRILVYDRDFAMPEIPRVPAISSSGAVLEWNTRMAGPTQVRLRRGVYPPGTPGQPEVDDERDVVLSGEPSTSHRAELKDLEPGTRYYYRLWIPETRTIPGKGWSREFAFCTDPPSGKMTYLRMPVKLLLLPNVIDVESLPVKEPPPLPEPMSPEDIRRLYKESFDETVLFYWHNSSMRYFLDIDFYVDPTVYRKGRLPDGIGSECTSLPPVNSDASLQKLIRKEKVYFGQIVCEAEQRWNPREKRWEFQGSGGGTYGVEWPVPGRTHFLGGSDVAWLLCHEFKHQVESQYNASGLEREDDRMWFCHFAAKHDDPKTTNVEWSWDTAAAHGEHWDGIAWQLRRLTRIQYFRNMYGILETAADADDDGIPDDAPDLPSDEKRLGGDPRKRDTDGDGLEDLREILASTWVRAINTDVRRRVRGEWIRPNLRSPDSDGDGIRNGEDPYPIYPFAPIVRLGTVKVDGNVTDMGAPQCRLDDLSVYSRHDDEWLYFGIILRSPRGKIRLTTDQDADGFYVGNDNACITLSADGALESVQLHFGAMNRWPHYDPKAISPDRLKHASRRRSDGSVEIELAIPKGFGLECKSGERVGFMITVDRLEGGALSLFEPYSFFVSTLE